ncbi:hypothetical protein ACIQ9Q_39935 [Streptomyces sp. NPDC094438]|uniref:hypothetical protein n=1 Tax=Streptomyces sp. NPDC094438 TaxID=3366061 RepID=UPI003814B0D0
MGGSAQWLGEAEDFDPVEDAATAGAFAEQEAEAWEAARPGSLGFPQRPGLER